jgi:hypothetical protein
MPNSPSSQLPHPQSYDTSVPGIATDLVTGLVWQRAGSAVSSGPNGDPVYALDQAVTYCAGLALGGFSDWRVPSRIELVSLLDVTASGGEDAAFSGPQGSYLSSSLHGAGTPSGVLGTVSFNQPGGGVTYLQTMGLPAMADGGSIGILIQSPVAVRCVRGRVSAAAPHYTVDSGTVHDRWTGLTWTQSLSSSSMLPSTVGSYCSSLTLGGGGWRAPSVNEIETLWGDPSNPDTVSLDPTLFAATIQLGPPYLGTRDVEWGSTSSAMPWYYANAQAHTGVQEDVYPSLLPPIINLGTEPPQDYWFYAECVK